MSVEGEAGCREVRANAALVVVCSAGMSIVGGTLWPLLPSLGVAALVVSRVERPWLGRGWRVPLAALATALGIWRWRVIGEDVFVALATFLLAMQWTFLMIARVPRERTQLLWINLVHFGVLAVSSGDSWFAAYALLFGLALASALAARRDLDRGRATARIVSRCGRRERRARRVAMGLFRGSVLVVTALAFLVFPRGSHKWQRLLSQGGQRTGYSGRVDLDKSGQLKKDHRVVMRVEPLKGGLPAQVYLRGAVHDLYVRRRWHTPFPEWQGELSREGNTFLDVPWRLEREVTSELRIHVEGLQTWTLFSLGPAASVTRSESDRQVWFGLHGELRAPRRVSPGSWYVVAGWPEEPFPSLPGAASVHQRRRALALPSRELRVQLQGLAAELYRSVGASPRTAAERSDALVKAFAAGFRYDLNIADAGEQDPVLFFLSASRAGHCELFASAMTLLLRAEGVPARMVTGFLSDEWDPGLGQLVVRQSHAHAWVEVQGGDGRWYLVDPTPPDLGEDEEMSWSAALGRFDELWSRHVMGFSSVDQSSFWARLSVEGVGAEGFALDGWGGLKGPGRGLLGAAGAGLAVALLGLGRRAWRRRRRRRLLAAHALPEGLAAALALGEVLEALARRGWGRAPAETLTSWGRRLRSEMASGEELVGWLEAYRALRFGPPSGRTPARDAEVAAGLRQALERLPRAARGGA